MTTEPKKSYIEKKADAPLSEVFAEAEAAVDEYGTEEGCTPCDVSAALTVCMGVCNTFKDAGMDCAEIMGIFQNPDEHTVKTAVEAMERLRDEAPEGGKEQMEYLLQLLNNIGADEDSNVGTEGGE